MYSIVQSRRIRGNAGDPIRTVFDSFDEKEIVFRRGQLVIISAAPGTGKSALALTEVIRSEESGLYLSPDSDAFTQVSRALSIHSGLHMAESKAYARGEEIDARTAQAAAKLAGIPIRFNYLASPNLTDIERSIDAFYELYGEYPSWIVIDNITNVQNGTEANDQDPFGGLEAFLDYAHTMARDTQACVVGLHHVTGPYNDADKPVPLSGVKGQIGRVPEMVLTLFRPTPETIGVSAVKNRGAKADTSGHWYAELEFDGEHMTFRDKDYSEPYVPEPGDGDDPFAVDRRREEE